MNYGLTKNTNLVEIVFDVCFALSPASGKVDKAACLLLETMAAETAIGRVKDPQGTFAPVGVGLCQFDQIGLDDIQQHLRKKHRLAIADAFGVEFDEVTLRDLAVSPVLSIIACRLKYMRVEAAIPDTLEKRAKYWKDHYNSHAPTAKGTPNHFIKSAEKYVPLTWANWKAYK